MYAEAEDWIDERLGEARRDGKAAVTDAAAIRIATLLEGKLGEAPLSKKEVAAIGLDFFYWVLI